MNSREYLRSLNFRQLLVTDYELIASPLKNERQAPKLRPQTLTLTQLSPATSN